MALLAQAEALEHPAHATTAQKELRLQWIRKCRGQWTSSVGLPESLMVAADCFLVQLRAYLCLPHSRLDQFQRSCAFPPSASIVHEKRASGSLAQMNCFPLRLAP